MDDKKVLIFGYNHLSYELVTRLDSEYDITIVDSGEALKLANQKGFTVANIDFREDKQLKSLGIGKSINAIFCFFKEDYNNVFLTLSARSLDADLQIISIVENPDSAEKLLAAGANKIINPYQICGRKIYDMVTKPEISDVLEQTVFGRHDLNIADIEIPKKSPLENQLLADISLKQPYNLILIGVVDRKLGELLHFSMGKKNHKLAIGDTLVIMGTAHNIRKFTHDIISLKEL